MEHFPSTPVPLLKIAKKKTLHFGQKHTSAFESLLPQVGNGHFQQSMKQNLSTERLLSDSLGFLGHARRHNAEANLSPEVFNRSRLIERYLDFLKVGCFYL